VLEVGQWNHVATTYDGTTYRLYVGGAEVATIGGFTGQAPLPLTSLNIGRVDNNFQGGIDDVRVYNTALTPSEIADLAQVVIPPPPTGPPGLVGRWRLDEQTLGTLAAEETGLSRPGTPRNFAAPHGPNTDVALADGALAPRSVSFDGVNDFVQIANSPALDFSGGQFTQSVWIRPKLTDTGFHGVLGHHQSLNTRAPSIWVFGQTRIHAGFGNGTSWNSFVTGPVLQHDAWNHVVVTFDGTQYRLYHNGQLAHTDTSAAGKVPVSSSQMDIGRVDNYFAGLIDDVRVFNRALSATEVSDLFEDVQADTGTISLAQNDYLLDESTGMAQVTIVRTAGSTTTATVDFTTISGSATPNQDYSQRSGQITFQPGQTSATVNVFLLDDTQVEDTESFGFAIDRVTGTTLGVVRTANVKIFDNDLPPGTGQPPGTPIVVFTDATYQYREDGGPATLKVFRAGSTASAIGVSFTTGSGTAAPGSDFTPVSGTINIPAGARVGTISVPLVDDANAEPNETVQVLLTGVGGGVLGMDAVAQVAILDDDSGDFIRETVVSGLATPTTFDFMPNGRILIGDQSGIVRVAQNGVLLPAPFIDIRGQVNHSQDRGLIGLAVHPNFPTSPYVYLLFVYDPPETQGQTGLAGPDQPGNRVSRLIRVEADPASNFATAKPGSEVVILGQNSVWANISRPDQDGTQDVTLPPSCGTGSTLNDCLPADAVSHAIGMVAFGPDGALYVSSGDASSFGRVDPRAARALDLNSLVGKILRIDPATGGGLSDNPFFDPLAPASNRSRVYSYGLRNPFRFALHPQTGEPFVGDVGWNNWEEVNTGRGLNFGWPYYEGGTGGVSLRTNGYQDLPAAQAFYASGAPVAPPLHARSHDEGAVAITVGDFYTGTTFPPLYHDALFYADLLEGTVEAIVFDAQGDVESISRFADGVPGIVQMQTGSDGNLYFLNIFNGTLERFVPATGGAAAVVVAPSETYDGAVADGQLQSTMADAIESLNHARTEGAFDAARFQAARGIARLAAARDRAFEELAAPANGTSRASALKSIAAGVHLCSGSNDDHVELPLQSELSSTLDTALPDFQAPLQ
jgi:glucose/arabinose dehydrogenase